VAYWSALVLTLVVEAPVWAALAPLGSPLRWPPPARLAGRAAAVGSLATVVTHPVLWFVAVPALRSAIGGSVVPVLVAEALACGVEAALVALLLPARRDAAVAAAVAANALSLTVGLLAW